MEITAFGLIVGGIGLLLLTRPAPYMLGFVIVCTVFSGSAAISLPALGGASIQPAYFALAFLAVRLFLSRLGSLPNIFLSLRRMPFLTVFCLYSAITAFLLPRLFAGSLNVVPLTPLTSRLYDIYPLTFSAQNITTAFYLVGTLFLAVAGSVVFGASSSRSIIVKSLCLAASLHVLFGILDITLTSMGVAKGLDFLRNGNYAQLSQDVDGVRRISGTFPEPSAYARYAFIMLVFLTELWIANIQPKLTGVLAVSLFVISLLSTSSTAYVSLAAYGLVLALRLSLVPSSATLSKKLVMACFIGVGLIILLALPILNPAYFDVVSGIFQRMTFGKLASDSGVQRSFWAWQGLDAFRVSYGLGVGAGSFRSSSLLTAIIGSTGVIGISAFLAHLIMASRQLVAQSDSLGGDKLLRVAAWGVLLGLIPDLIGAPSADPGLFFGLFSGLAFCDLRAPSPLYRRATALN